MAKHYYTIEVVVSNLLDEEDIDDLESTVWHCLAALSNGASKITTEYVDSEG